MTSFLSRLFSPCSSTSQTRPPQGSEDRKVRFNPYIQYRRIPARGTGQGLDLRSPGDSLRGSPSTRRPRDTLRPRRSGRNSSRSGRERNAAPIQNMRQQGSWNAPQNSFTPNQGTPIRSHLQTFVRRPNDPPTPWVREAALPRGSPSATTSPWPPTTHIPQGNQNATQGLHIPIPPVSLGQPPFLWAPHPPKAQLNPVQRSRSSIPVVSASQTNVDNSTPQVTYSWTASITQPQNQPPPKLWTPPGSRPQMHPLNNSSTSSRSVPSSWGTPCNFGTPQVPFIQNEPTRAVPVIFSNGNSGNRSEKLPDFMPSAQSRIHRYPSRHRNQTDNPGERVAGSENMLRGDQLHTLLTSGKLNWDVRFFPEMSTFLPARPYAPDLDLPALSYEIATALIEFENTRLRIFNELWGPIRVQNSRVSTNNFGTFISIRNIMEAIHQYVMTPITREDKSRFMAVRRQEEEFNVTFATRISIQGRLDDCHRRADLLPGGMVNFRRIVVDSEGGSVARLRLVLY